MVYRLSTVGIVGKVKFRRAGHVCLVCQSSGILYTDAFEKTQLARIRGVCSAITRPGESVIDRE